MKKTLTPEQREAIRKKYANHGYDEYGSFEVIKAKPQPPEGWKEQGK